MLMIKPPPFTSGKKIGIVALAGPLDQRLLLRGEDYLKQLGFDVLIAPSCFKQLGYLAGENDAERALDLKMLFVDDEIGAIINMRGGYGSNRIMPYLKDFNFAKYPKPFIGYSDITYIHIYLNQQHQLITYHGPMVKDLLKNVQLTTASFINTCLNGDVLTLDHISFLGNKKQQITGRTVGGNLSIIASTIGTPYEIDTKGKILFLEEVNEANYSLDRLLMQLSYAGKLDECAGIILGDFNGAHRQSLLATVKQVLLPTKKAIAYNVAAGHTSPNISIPLGAQCRFDVLAKQLIFLE